MHDSTYWLRDLGNVSWTSEYRSARRCALTIKLWSQFLYPTNLKFWTMNDNKDKHYYIYLPSLHLTDITHCPNSFSRIVWLGIAICLPYVGKSSWFPVKIQSWLSFFVFNFKARNFCASNHSPLVKTFCFGSGVGNRGHFDPEGSALAI